MSEPMSRVTVNTGQFKVQFDVLTESRRGFERDLRREYQAIHGKPMTATFSDQKLVRDPNR